MLDIVEAHCYFVDIGRIDREQIRSRINNNDCRTFRPRRPLSTAYRTVQNCTELYRTVLYAVDKGLRGRNVLQSLLLILLRICSRSIRPTVCFMQYAYCSCVISRMSELSRAIEPPQFASCMMHNASCKRLCSGNERSLFHMIWNSLIYRCFMCWPVPENVHIDWHV